MHRHKWQVDDVLMWNNKYTMHCVEPYDAAKEKTPVHRVVMRGDRSVQSIQIKKFIFLKFILQMIKAKNLIRNLTKLVMEINIFNVNKVSYLD